MHRTELQEVRMEISQADDRVLVAKQAEVPKSPQNVTY